MLKITLTECERIVKAMVFAKINSNLTFHNQESLRLLIVVAGPDSKRLRFSALMGIRRGHATGEERQRTSWQHCMLEVSEIVLFLPDELPELIATLITVIIVGMSMTYPVMPQVTRLFRTWLFRSPSS
jgi:hypothetical protein